MTTFQAIAAGLGLLALATLILTIWPAVLRHRVLMTVVVALLTSAASAAISTERDSGMGTQISRGYPRSYFFHWHSFEGPEEHRAFNMIYFAANTFVHCGVVAVVAAAWPRPRRHSSTMPLRMLLIRLTLGVFFLIMAVIGGLLPVLQGWLFLLLAILVLFPRTAFAEKVLSKAEPKLPRVVALLRRLGIGTQFQ